MLFLSLFSFLTINCFTYDEYIFNCQGNFAFFQEYNSRYSLHEFSFESATIHAATSSLDIDKHDDIGTVEKLNGWTSAYNYKVNGSVLSTHRSRFLSYGIFFDYLKDYEVFDSDDTIIGYIEGNFEVDAAATFHFYDAHHTLFAKAHLNKSYFSLTVTSPDNRPLFSCEKTLYANYYPSTLKKTEYYWTIKKISSDSFDMRFFWPFMAFLSDVWAL